VLERPGHLAEVGRGAGQIAVGIEHVREGRGQRRPANHIHAGDLGIVGSGEHRHQQFAGATIAALVRRTGEPARMVEQSPPELPGGCYAAVGAPIKVAGTLLGAITALCRQDCPLPDDTEARMAKFTDLVGTAIANAQARADLMASRVRIVTAADEARRRIERNLHDGIQQRLVALALRVRAVQEGSPPEAQEVRQELSALDATLTETLQELRDVCQGIHPRVLSRGLMPALKLLSNRSELPTELDLRVGDVLPPSVAAAAYFVVAEAFSNAAKHAQPSVVRLSGEVRKDRLLLTVGDDGVGGADPSGALSSALSTG
jgi:signal transduction histidine kinase